MTKKGVKEKITRTGPPPRKPGCHYINIGQDDQMELIGFYPSLPRMVAVWMLQVATAGILRLFFYWFPHLMVRCTHRKCELAQAEVVIIQDQYKQWFVSKVKTDNKEGGRSSKTWKKKENDPVSGVRNHSFLSSVESMTSLADVSSDKIFSPSSRYFISKKVKYIWNKQRNTFEKLRGLEHNTNCSYFYTMNGLKKDEQLKRRALFGENAIRVHVSPVIEILLKQIMSPFYIFQMFSCALWLWEQYYYYTISLLVINFFSVASYIYQTRKMQKALKDTISMSTMVNVYRGEQVSEEISSENLVPGDVIEIPKRGCLMHCDAVLVSGDCIVNESMLTGESVPLTKTPLPGHHKSYNKTFNIIEHSRHILFCGTKVIQTRQQGQDKVKAVVVRTGFSTTKGELVRSILYPKPVDFKYQRDSYIFIGFLAFVGAIGFSYTITLMVKRGESVSDIIMQSLDLVTTAVPAALPLALTVGVVFAQNRLRNRDIYCISPNSITVSGSVNVFCFDKTGTLTDDGLNLLGVVPVTEYRFAEKTANVQDLLGSPLFYAMATCHSLTKIEGEIIGDPIDQIMFEPTLSSLEEPDQVHTKFHFPVPTVVKMPSPTTGKKEYVGIARQFTFTSNLQRMSVIVTGGGPTGDRLELYCKGAPEMIASLSLPDTVPPDFHDVLRRYTKHGYRVLALGARNLVGHVKKEQINRVTRENVEKDLIFLGLLVMENCLKRETTPVIHQLREADIKTVMVTGDNILTALSVAEECGIVSQSEQVILVNVKEQPGHPVEIEYTYAENNGNNLDTHENKMDVKVAITSSFYDQKFCFAMDGKTWAAVRQYHPELLPKLVVRGRVFARMSPEQKAQLVESLQEIGYFVGMCGDGANDCGALKTAHAGISLSEAEASVASPFTSKTPNIQCVPTLIREGRAALVTSFGTFKFMACYSLTEFTSMSILYWVSANMSDFEFLYVDMFLLTTLVVTFGRTAGCDFLSKRAPIVNLFSVGPVLSVLTLVGIQAMFQVITFLHVHQQVWFVPLVSRWEYDYVCYQNNAIFIMSSYQYIVLSIALSKGEPYRKSMFSNYWFVGNILVCTCMTIWLTMYPTDGLTEFFELKPFPPIVYRAFYLGLALMDLLICVMIEDYIISETFVSHKLQSKLEGLLIGTRYKHLLLEEEIKDSDWPNVKQPSLSSNDNEPRLTTNVDQMTRL